MNHQTKAQIETMAQVITVLANALDLTIDKARVMTHGEAADNEDGVWCHEPYGPNLVPWNAGIWNT